MNLKDLDEKFFHLEDWCRSLAYWIFAIKDMTAPELRSSKEMALKLSAQYDAEGQASVGDDDAWGHPDFALSAIKCVAPVQLAFDWSPMPAAYALLGPPDFLDVRTEGTFPSALAVWKTPTLIKKPKMHGHFSVRLQSLTEICISHDLPIGLSACRGFAFDDEDKFLSDVAQQALSVAGFKFLDRSPV
jgi:hypothetical protein